MPRLGAAPAPALLALTMFAPHVAACGANVQDCEDRLELRFDESLPRDYILVLTLGEDTARIDCSHATHPSADASNTVEVTVEGTLEGRAICSEESIVLVDLTPESGGLTLTYRSRVDVDTYETLRSDFAITYDEVEASEGTCRRAVATVDVGCPEGSTYDDCSGVRY